MTEDVQTQQPTAEETPNQQPQSSIDLNVNDLVTLKNIVDVASQRGAFKASELEMVGKVYNKLSTFLESVGKKQET